MVEHSAKILASEAEATTTTTITHPLVSERERERRGKKGKIGHVIVTNCENRV